MTITDLCDEVNNWFDVSKHIGTFEIKDGTITLDFLSEGQFFRIIDSTFNDGVYQYPCCDLRDEQFDGAIWAMAVPRSFLHLLDEINEWENVNKKAIDSPYQSESFGGYSYSKGENSSFKTRFKDELRRWRKI